ncbi:hypothetical protein J5751_04735 [bacterium]|nr:hypothetical protein [bacterium]
MSVAKIKNSIGNITYVLLNIWYQSILRFNTVFSPKSSIVVKKYTPNNNDNLALFNKYNLFVIILVIKVAIIAITKNMILVFTHNTAIESPKSNGLNVQNTEKPIICLNAVTTKAANVRVSSNPIKLMGIQLAIKLSIKYDKNNHLDFHSKDNGNTSINFSHNTSLPNDKFEIRAIKSLEFIMYLFSFSKMFEYLDNVLFTKYLLVLFTINIVLFDRFISLSSSNFERI